LIWLFAGVAALALGALVHALTRTGGPTDHPVLTPLAEALEGRLIYGSKAMWIIEGREGGGAWRIHIDQIGQRFRLRPAVIGRSLPGLCRLSKEGFRASGDPEVGDGPFDAVFHLQGDPAYWSAALSIDMRDLLLRQVQTAPVDLRSGELMLHVDAILPTYLDGVHQAMRLRDSLLPVASGLFPWPSDIPDRLFDRATTDPLQRVRRIAAGHLLSRHALHPAAHTLQSLLKDASDPALRALATDDEEGLIAALDDEDVPVRAAVCRALGRVGGRRARRALARVGSEESKAAILRLDARLGSAEAGAVAVVGGGELSVTSVRRAPRTPEE
jgi:hypothetical protein